MHEYDADTVPPGASPEPAPVEYAADDLQEIYEQGNKLRSLLEGKIDRFLASRSDAVSSLARKLEGLRDALEQTLADVDAKVDAVAGRGPHDTPDS